MYINRGFLNVMILSWGFMLNFTAFQTVSNIEKNVLDGVSKEDPNFKVDGYLSQCIIYASFALCNWLAPSFISMTGPRVSIIAGNLCYIFFIASFFHLRTDLLYFASALVGLGAALLWTGQGHYLTINSDEDTTSRNFGIFWTIYQSSQFLGNLFVAIQFQDAEIDKATRNLVFTVLTGVSLAGLGLFLTMQRPPQKAPLGPAEGVSSADKELQKPEQPREKPLFAAWRALCDAFRLFVTPRMLVLSLTFIYTGLELTFFSSIYSSSIGFTKALGDGRKSLIGMSGIFVGIGEVVGGAVFGVLATKYCGEAAIYLVIGAGFAMHAIAYVIARLIFPANALFTDTDDTGIIPATPVLALAGSLALGLGDACFGTQLFSFLGTAYSSNSAAAFALLNFFQSIAATTCFFYSSYLGLDIQIVIQSCWLIVGTGAFFFVNLSYRRDKKLSNIT